MEDRLPTVEELRLDFEGVPLDPWTGEPIGFVGMAVELEARRAEQADRLRRDRGFQEVERVVHGQRVRVTLCPPRGSDQRKSA